MNHEVMDAHAAAYALGALDGDERVDFESHLAQGCARCEATLRESAEALAALAREAPPAVPPAHVREALLLRASASAPRPSPAELRRTWLRWTAVAAAAMLVGGFLAGGWVASRYEARLGYAARQMTALRDQLRREEAALRARVAQYESVVELLRDPATRVAVLRGAGPSPEAYGRVVWQEAAGGHVLVARLPPTPEGKAYEAWTITGGRPRPAGVFRVDASGHAVHRVDPTGGPVDVFAVTIEPEAGTPAPTGPIVLVSAK
ncbi:MAG: anti-sigma factor domain-containing protein [Candidatus Rokuibacteriota bacterium]